MKEVKDMELKFSPVACLASKRARALLPGTLRDARVLYQVKPVTESGAVLVCAHPECCGHTCTTLPANLLVPLFDVCVACGRAAGDGTACDGCPVRDLASA